ncbi:MAG TPA: hypothetical protein PLX23_03135, partial [Candidatus Hydrogenedens sp.]|nr:hypothetical protein [Candidatus Hydrogenedens sp.]
VGAYSDTTPIDGATETSFFCGGIVFCGCNVHILWMYHLFADVSFLRRMQYAPTFPEFLNGPSYDI